MTIVDDVDEPPELQKDMFWNQVGGFSFLKGVVCLFRSPHSASIDLWFVGIYAINRHIPFRK